MYDGEPKQIEFETLPDSLITNVFYNGTTSVPSLPGEYQVTISVDDENYYGILETKFVISSTQKFPSIYPNPVTNTFSLVLEPDVSGYFTITNQLGVEVYRDALHSDPIDISNLPIGLYLITAYTENGLINTIRMIKVNK